MIHQDGFRCALIARAGGKLKIVKKLNLPARLKMTEPRHVGSQKNDIPELKSDNERVTVNLISGDGDDAEDARVPLADVTLSSIHFKQGGRPGRDVAAERSVFFYVVSGELMVNGERASARHIVEFNRDGERKEIETRTSAAIPFGHAEPNDEPLAARGPFVMNTDAEIAQAIRDYQAGKFGVWND